MEKKICLCVDRVDEDAAERDRELKMREREAIEEMSCSVCEERDICPKRIRESSLENEAESL